MRLGIWSWTAAGVFVGSAWVLLTVAAIYYVVHFGSPDPFGDEWDLMPGVTYSEPFLPWLWAQHNEHRLPLPKLVYTWLWNLGHCDTRVSSLATVAILSAASLAFVFASRRARGSTDYADAFFPIAFLNWGHFEDYLIGFQVSFALSMGLVCLWMLIALGGGPWRLAGWALVLLPLCGAHGLVYAPPLGLATLWLTRSLPRPHRIGFALTVALSLLLCAFYFRGYESPAQHPHSAGIIPSLKIATEVLALGWGWVGQMSWPISGAMSIALIILCGAVAAAAVRLTDQTAQLYALAAVAVGAILLAGGIGWGRSGFGPLAGFADRYAMLMLPLMGAAYLMQVKYGGQFLRSIVPMGMFTAACLFLTQHCRTGIAEGQASAARMRAFAEDLHSGMSSQELAQRHPALYPDPVAFAARVQLLKSAGVPRYSMENSAFHARR